MAGRGNIPSGKVQRAFYLREDVAEALRRVAFERRESQSEIVEQALRRDLGMWTRADIHNATGFDNGDLFRSEEEVRQYFTVQNITDMFGECPFSQPELDEMAEAVIANRWHMAEAEYCHICSENGMETAATRYALGMHLCDECAREYESYLKPGERLEDMTEEEMDRRLYSR